MKRRTFGWILGSMGLLGVAATGWFVATNGIIEVPISHAEVQRRVDERLPFQGRRGPVSYEVRSAVLVFRPDGRIGFDAAFTIDASGREGAGNIVGSGRLEYADGAFMLRGFDSETLTLERLAPPQAREPSRLRQTASNLAASLAQRAGVEDEIRELVEASREAVILRTREAVVSGIRGRLDTQPVYRLRTDEVKHSLARLALKEIRTESDRLVVVLDPVTALLRVLGYVALVVFSIFLGLGALLAFGGWGVGGLLVLGSLSS